MKQIVQEVYEAMDILLSKGYEVYLVGGAVRSILLKSEIHDFDLTTSASPEIVISLFNNYPIYRIGEKHGTVVVMINGLPLEITTFRSDVAYIDHRHPTEVIFSDHLQDDLKRRDFTINAMCIDRDDNLIDLYGGVKDLENKIIRTIGDPYTRFNEDALRILRAIRFSSKLGFSIEENTKKAMFDLKDLLNYISMERKKEELLGILSGTNKYNLINDYLEIYNTFVPFNKIDKKIDNFTNPYFSLAYLLSKTNNYSLKELKFSKKEINLLEALIEAGNTDISNDYDFVSLLSLEYYKEILDYLNELYSNDFNQRYIELKKCIVSRGTLDIDGKSLMELGYKGKEIKDIQEKLVKLIRQGKLDNDKSSLIKYLKDK